MSAARRVGGPAALVIVGRVFMILGLMALALGVYFGGNELRGRHTATAPGKIVTVGSLPAIEFTMADGSIIRFTNSVRSSSWHVGDEVSVAYDPANPSDAVVDDLVGRWFSAALAGLLGAVFLLLGVVLTVFGRRARRAGRA